MKLMNLRKKSWPGFFGVLGLLGFVPKTNGEPNYFMFILFTLFSWFIWSKLERENQDERLIENLQKAYMLVGRLSMLLVFFILFFLDRGTVSKDIIILCGTLAYSIMFTLVPALTYYFDRIE